MSLSSNNWFKYINEMRLNEGVRDIGLPEVVIDRIEDTLSDSSEVRRKTHLFILHHNK